ncbi:MAG: ATP-binding protein [Candidatus Buchananbacteria bacterium]|jgi:signal transduction histidine kinase
MNIYAIVAIINFFSSIFLGTFVFFSNKEDKVNASFSLFAFTVAFWSIGYYYWQLASDPISALFWCRLLMAPAIFIPFTYLYFIYSFVGLLPKRRKFLILTFIISLIFLILDFTPLFVIGVEPILTFKFWPMAGPAFAPFLIIWFFYVVYSCSLLYKKYIQSEGIIKIQIIYVLVGMTIGFIGGSTNYFLWYKIPIPPITNILVTFYVAAVAYAIIKHHLMNIKVIATELFSVFLIVITFLQIFQTSQISVYFRVVIFIITLFFAVLLVRSVLHEVHRREEMEALNKKLNKVTKDLASANKELKRLDESKSEFLSISSHQLRTPLTIIKGYSSMLLEGSFGKMTKPVKESIDKIFVSTERLINLVESLLNISRIEAGRIEFTIEPVDLTEVAKSMVNDFQEKAKARKLKLAFMSKEKVPKVAADAQKIKDIVSNIIDNAIKYTKQGEIMVGLHQEGTSVVFTSQDTGMGMDADDIKRLFNKFTRGKDSAKVNTEGTGLGLYYARVLVENMGGRIWVESPGKNKGSKFCFSLPMADRKQAKKIS